MNNVNKVNQETAVITGKVLVALDGFELSEKILPLVCSLASQLELPLLLLSVVDQRALDPKAGLFDTYGAWETALRKHLPQVAQKLCRLGVHVETRVAYGIPDKTIVEVAREEECGLIALLTHGRNLLGWTALGSVAYNVIQSADVPVLAVTPSRAAKISRSPEAMRTIIVPLDGSPRSEEALPFAAGLARKMGLEILITQAVASAEAFPPFLAETIPVQMEEERQEEASAYLDGVCRRLCGQGLKARRRLLMGSPTSELLKLIRRTPHSLVVIASRGRSMVLTRVLGSTALSILRLSASPVFILPVAETGGRSE